MSKIDGKNVDSLLFGVKVKALYNAGTMPSHSSKAGLSFLHSNVIRKAGDRLL